VVVRDDALPDARTLRPKLYHIYRDPSVSEDLNRKAERLRRTAFDLRTCRRW
jgi:type III restriction enzyme